jgi:hypothetical protein
MGKPKRLGRSEPFPKNCRQPDLVPGIDGRGTNSGRVFERNDFEAVEILPDFRRRQPVTDMLKRAPPRLTITHAIRTIE